MNALPGCLMPISYSEALSLYHLQGNPIALHRCETRGRRDQNAIVCEGQILTSNDLLFFNAVSLLWNTKLEYIVKQLYWRFV